MRLRRLEFVIIGVTLAFACFMGGFFAGRSWSAVNIVSVAAQIEGREEPEIFPQIPGESGQERININSNPSTPGTDTNSVSSNDQKSVTPSETTGQPRSGDGKININLATQSELTDLPGIGSVLASRIIDYRRQHGDFHKIEDIRNVSGIGEKRYEAIQEKITVG